MKCVFPSGKSKTGNTPFLKLPNTENVSLVEEHKTVFLAILTLTCLASVYAILPLVSCLLINRTGLEYAEKPSFIKPK